MLIEYSADNVPTIAVDFEATTRSLRKKKALAAGGVIWSEPDPVSTRERLMNDFTPDWPTIEGFGVNVIESPPSTPAVTSTHSVEEGCFLPLGLGNVDAWPNPAAEGE
jgi:hypothetical protein